ncbi:PREDICTED: zinc finger MYM-type protein 1-like [Nicotiana attenuata]|uniref:zinc finger MYM-type protein 1-like n=1 Tax=Nicotiana attenuata TaxID=49451 RepID=UPI0009053E35|nr:PREDICTED: zinc finger MYM-type protein 1-like [Nicotiana attenuata]
MRLNASIDVVRFLLRNGFPFRGHDESEDSEYKGIFLELLKFHGDKHPDVGKVILRHAPKNDMMICPTIQKEIVYACAKETIKAIIKDLDGDYFGISVDESKDISHKEQMALVLRYVNKNGEVIERFLGIVHVKYTYAQSLKDAIYSLILDDSLSSSKIRGQGYDGASNVQGKINGLKTLILQDAPSAYYIHCFAHQLQLTTLALSKKHLDVNNFFDVVTNLLNTIGASFKLRELLRQHQVEKLQELLKNGEVYTGQGLNQECGLQRSDQDIVNAMRLLDLAKIRLQTMRESELESLMDEVYSFCGNHGILVPKMDERYPRSKHKRSDVSYSHHFRVELFYAIIDFQLLELNYRFDVVTSDLLLGMASLNPVDSFANFDEDRIMKLAEYYPSEFVIGSFGISVTSLIVSLSMLESVIPRFSI